MTSLKGLRCIAASEKYVFAGDNNGFLHMLNADNLEEITKVDERSRGTIAIAMSPTQELLVRRNKKILNR